MKTEVENAITVLSKKAGDANCMPDAALKITQAALNLAHVLATLDAIERNQK